MSKTPEPAARKPYAPPHVVVYGDIAQITQNVTNKGATMDNPKMNT